MKTAIETAKDRVDESKPPEQQVMSALEWCRIHHPDRIFEWNLKKMTEYAQYYHAAMNKHAVADVDVEETKLQEIKEYIDTKFKLYKDPKNEWILAELSKLVDSYIVEEKANAAIQSQSVQSKDAIAFAEWVDESNYVRLTNLNWNHINEMNELTTQQLYQLWQDSKNKQHH